MIGGPDKAVNRVENRMRGFIATVAQHKAYFNMGRDFLLEPSIDPEL